jgi:DNA-binding CsgD family transcriptional regulator
MLDSADTPDTLLQHGRDCFDRGEWNNAFESLSLADQSAPLVAADLERLSWSAGLTARDDEMFTTHERAYHAYLRENEPMAAARAGFWLGFRLLARGQASSSSGWLSRVQRLIDQHGGECVEQGYLLLPQSQRHLSAGEHDAALDAATRAASVGERFHEPDLVAFARNLQGRALLANGQVARGLECLDEAMIAATSAELSPVVTGIVYCSSIASCHRVYALDRVREWTAALSTWCAAHPQLGMFTGHCLAHRAEIMELGGLWNEAVEEARRAVERSARVIERDAGGRAHYQQAEIHRLRGEFTEAEAAYREASRMGVEPLPGLALLRLAQGDHETAAHAIRRAVEATVEPLQRTRFLPAFVEIMLAGQELDAARTASHELQQIAGNLQAEVLIAISAHAQAAVQLAEGNAHAAVEPLRQAFRFWQQLGAPYLAARLRALLARAYLAMDDTEGARLELQYAREEFERLNAQPDLLALQALEKTFDDSQGDDASETHGLTTRELQVLRLVASGKTNKSIARDLTLSEKTIDRHVSNIFTKIDVNTRSAATAFAYEKHLV